VCGANSGGDRGRLRYGGGDMSASPAADRAWKKAILVRGLAAGAGLAMATSAGSALVGAQAAVGPSGSVILLVTVLGALTIGLWAGAVDPGASPKLRDRWLAAGAFTAVAGAYASFSALYQQIYPGSFWAIVSLVLTVAVPAYVAGLVPPALIAWQATAREGHEDNEEAVPDLTGLLIIAVLAGSACGLLAAAFVALPQLSPGSVLMLAAALLLAPLTLHDPAEDRPRESTVFETISPFGTLRVTEVAFPGERQPERRLYLNDEEESGELVRSGAPTLAYIAAAEALLASTTAPGASYLFLGGGAYTLPRRMAERDSRARITVLELDPEVTRIAYRYFGLEPHHRIISAHGDARAYLEAAAEPRYDRMYVDVYGGEESLPYSIVTQEAALAMLARLKPGGFMAMNLIGTVAGDEIRQPWSIVTTFAEVFPSLAVYTHLGRDYPDRQNILLVGAVEAGVEFPLSVGTFDLWPSVDWPPAQGFIIFRDLLSSREDNQIAQRALGAPAPRTRRL
jgi:hypothetical protein